MAQVRATLAADCFHAFHAVAAVSYTHLDVYKRQNQDGLTGQVHLGAEVFGAVEALFLDVYKRQIRGCWVK